MTTYYLGHTKSGAPVTRGSTRNDFTHAAVLAGHQGHEMPSFSTSAAGALKNASCNGRNPNLEVVEVRIVTSKEYNEAKRAIQAMKDGKVTQAAAAAVAAAPKASKAAKGDPKLHQLREAWLNALVDASRPMFTQVGFELPANVRVSIGWPSRGIRSKSIGECWAAEASSDKHFEIFLRPSLVGNDMRIADVLVHELCHAAAGLEAKHGPKFGKVARAMGLEGKLTATIGGEQFKAWMQPHLDALGAMPGGRLEGMQTSAPKTQTTRMIKLECECGWSCRTSAKNIEAMEEGSFPCPTGCGGTVAPQGAQGDDA